ncbi:hypothetical protein SEA_CONFIDENCE_56 [Gordonia phage Confidence]|nr:hypothetical protein SEA_CONFIDENCE_56 [Gordonia phage Confidence]
MTAPAIHPAAIDAALPDFDAEVRCEFYDECERPAVWRVVAHGVADEDEACSVRPYLMCDICLAEMRALIEETLRIEGYCDSCGKTFRQVSDVILSVVAL